MKVSDFCLRVDFLTLLATHLWMIHELGAVNQQHYGRSPEIFLTLIFSANFTIGGFHVTSLPPCWWTKTKDLSLASFVRAPQVVHFPIVIGVPRGWLKTSY